MTSALLFAALSVLPADRLLMADRLFNRGKYAEAAVEYRALASEKDLAADQILFRLAECNRALGQNEMATKLYAALAEKYPDSEHAPQARLFRALSASGAERVKLLEALDSDRVDAKIRAAALYHLGVAKNDAAAFEKCVKVDPKGRYALHAELRRGSILNASSEAKDRRKGVELLLGIAFGGGPLADEALYLAAAQSYRERKYDEAGSLLRRYRKNYPNGAHAADALTMSVWCDFMSGRYADAAAACGEGKTDDLAYVKAACAHAAGNDSEAVALFKRYLENFPQGRYRKDVALPLARIEFERASKTDDLAKTVETAKSAFALSGLASDELRLAWAYEKSGKADLATAEYAKICAQHPGTSEAAEAAYASAMLFARAGNWSKAELSFAEALATDKLGKRRASALYWRGIAAIKIDHPEEGANFLREAQKLGLGLDESREARLMVADQDLRTGKEDVAKAAYVTLVREGAAARMSAARLYEVANLLFGQPEAKTCAEALAKGESAEWRQLAYALLGRMHEQEKSYEAAIADYRKCLDEKCPMTREAAEVLLRLGVLESRAGAYDRAEETLKRAVKENGSVPRIRAEAYVALAKNCEAKKDFAGARGYATVVTALFDDKELCAEAARILKAHPEEAK